MTSRPYGSPSKALTRDILAILKRGFVVEVHLEREGHQPFDGSVRTISNENEIDVVLQDAFRDARVLKKKQGPEGTGKIFLAEGNYRRQVA